MTKHSHRQPKLFNIRTHYSTSIISFACHFECKILHCSFIEPLSVKTVRTKGRNRAIFSKSSLDPQPGHDSFTGTVSLCITRSVTHTRHPISKVLYLSAKSRRTRKKAHLHPWKNFGAEPGASAGSMRNRLGGADHHGHNTILPSSEAPSSVPLTSTSRRNYGPPGFVCTS